MKELGRNWDESCHVTGPKYQFTRIRGSHFATRFLISSWRDKRHFKYNRHSRTSAKMGMKFTRSEGCSMLILISKLRIRRRISNNQLWRARRGGWRRFHGRLTRKPRQSWRQQGRLPYTVDDQYLIICTDFRKRYIKAGHDQAMYRGVGLRSV